MIGPDGVSLPISVLAEFLNLFKSFILISLTNTKKILVFSYVCIYMYVYCHTCKYFYVCVCYTIPQRSLVSYSLWGPKESDTSECNDDGTLYIHIYMERERNLVKVSYKMIWEKCDIFIT